MLRLLILTTLLAMCLLAGACGGSDSSTPSSSGTTGTSTPEGAGSWSAQLSGAVTGAVGQGAYSTCIQSDGSYRVTLDGPVDSGGRLNVSLGSFAVGSFDYAQPASGLAITAKYTPASGSESTFTANAGAEGATGSLTVAASGGGSMQVSVPPSSSASEALKITATWNCS